MRTGEFVECSVDICWQGRLIGKLVVMKWEEYVTQHSNATTTLSSSLGLGADVLAFESVMAFGLPNPKEQVLMGTIISTMKSW